MQRPVFPAGLVSPALCTTSLPPLGTKIRLATDSQGSGGWGQPGPFHLTPHHFAPCGGWAHKGPPSHRVVHEAMASGSTHTSPARGHQPLW